MNRTLADLAEEALRLPQNDQQKPARAILEKDEACGSGEIDAAWEADIERRVQMIDKGGAQGRPFANVLHDIDRQLGRRT